MVEKVDVFLRVDLASETLSTTNLAKLVELQECVKEFLDSKTEASCSGTTT